MIIETPSASLYSAALLMGRLECKINDSGQMHCSDSPVSMAVVMKAAYDLDLDEDGIWQMSVVADPKRSAIVMDDRGSEQFVDEVQGKWIHHTISSKSYEPCDKDPKERVLVVGGRRLPLKQVNEDKRKWINFDLTYEADIALDKVLADIIVLGFIPAFMTGKVKGSPLQKSVVTVNNENWLTRSSFIPKASDTDMSRNLFGFEPREGDKRQQEVHNLRAYASMHRRAPDVFDDTGTSFQLPSAGVARIYQDTQVVDGRPVGKPDFTLQLPNLEQGIRLRIYCGHGPDEAPHWRKVNLGLMRPDTLIVDPDKCQAVILWRCHWRAGLEPMEYYRQVQILQGGFCNG